MTLRIKYQPFSDAEYYLYSLLKDASGLDLAEFAWVDEGRDDKCFRAWDFQWSWYRDDDTYQADQATRTCGKSEGIAMRGCAHPFNYAGQERLITAPELNHLRPVVDNIEKRLKAIWFLREMCPRDRHMGISRQPQWQIRFLNGAEIRSRLPNKSGQGVKGQHPAVIELDEAQDYPRPGWTEIIECLKNVPNAQWRIHGVPKGIRDIFWKFTTGQDPDLPFKVHRIMAMQRPTWNDLERRRKIAMYNGTPRDVDYRRNIYGDHGDATSPVFVLAKLMACTDLDETSYYNANVYTQIVVTDEKLTDIRGGKDFDDMPDAVEMLLDEIPDNHFSGYSAYFGGGDVGVTNHPSEFLIFGAVEKKEKLRLLLRLHMERVDIEDQKVVLKWLRRRYGGGGKVPFRLGVDRAGVGFGVWQPLSDSQIKDGLIVPNNGKDSWLQGFDFSETVVAELDTEIDGEVKDQMIRRNFLDYASEELRRLVHSEKLEMPNDNEVINQWQGQTTAPAQGNDMDPNRPKRRYSKGTYHTLDAGKYFAGSYGLLPLHLRIAAAMKPKNEPTYAYFPGSRTP